MNKKRNNWKNVSSIELIEYNVRNIQKKRNISKNSEKNYLGIQTGESDIAGDSIFSGIAGVLS
jgi:hypothetical protein